MRKISLSVVLGSALLVAACGSQDDGSPTAAENEQLDNIVNQLDVTDASPDSLVTEEAAIGNGESAETGDVLVAEGNAVANGQ